MAAEKSRDIVQLYFDKVYNQGDLSAADALVSSTYVGHIAAQPMEVRGPEGLKLYASTYRNALADLRLNVEKMDLVRDRIVTDWTAEGIHQGNLLGISPTGAREVLKGTSILRVYRGKIQEEWNTYRALSMFGSAAEASATFGTPGGGAYFGEGVAGSGAEPGGGGSFQPLPGWVSFVGGSIYQCPLGDFTWPRISPGEVVPNCPYHPERRLVRVDDE